MRVRLDLRGLEDVAKTADMRAGIDEAAEAVAENARSLGITVGDVDGGRHEIPLPVEVHGDDVTTNMRVNRAQARVTLAHPAGEAVQAKHGALTKAAAQAGLKPRSTA